MLERMLVPIYVPSWLQGPLRRIKRTFVPPAPTLVNTDGERYVEWTFLSSEMPDGPGEALEFGCEQGYMSFLAAQKGFRVLAVDLQEQHFQWRHSNVEFRLGDFLQLDLPEGHFDLLINCSSIEHVGISGRYGITAEHSNGDIEVMETFARVLRPGGLLLMSVPVGRDAVIAPLCRVYGEERLPRLLAPFQIEKERYWCKDHENRWASTTREEALSFQPLHDPARPQAISYALGGFVLRNDAGRSRNSSTKGDKC